jgi:hypothetical protein
VSGAEIALLILAGWYLTAWLFLAITADVDLLDRDAGFRLTAVFLGSPVLLGLLVWFWVQDFAAPTAWAYLKRCWRTRRGYWN